MGGTQGRGRRTGESGGESSRNEGRTSLVLSPTLGPWRQSIRMAEALTAQVHHIPVSSPRWFGVVSTLLN